MPPPSRIVEKKSLREQAVTGRSGRDGGQSSDAVGVSLQGALPLYEQVKSYILQLIGEGELAPNARIPSEKDLVEKFGVSRMTVNRALRELTSSGRLFRVQGVGTFVAAQKPKSPLLEVRSIAEEIVLRGGEHSSAVHLLALDTVPAELSMTMELPPNSTIFHSILVHMDRGEPVQLEERFVSPAIAPDYLEQDFSRTTPSQYLFKVAPLTEVEHIVEAVLPDPRTQDLLGIGPHEPCLLLKRRTWSHGTFVTLSLFTYPGSRHQIGSRFKTGPDANILLA